MNFKHLKTFVKLAHSGSFSLAAQQLHTVQSAVSRHINALERELEVTLFSRTTRQVELTAAGAAFLQHAEGLLRQTEQARVDAQRVQSGAQGTLRIGYLSSACAAFLPLLLRDFAAHAGQVRIEIVEMTAAQQFAALHHGNIDVGFSRPVHQHPATTIHSRHLLNDPIVAVMADNHPLAGAPQLSLTQLNEHKLTLFARQQAPTLFDTIISAFHAQQLQPSVSSEPVTMQALLTQLSCSRDIGLVPGCVSRLQTDLCHFVPLSTPLTVSLEMHWQQHPNAVTKRWLSWFEANASPASIAASMPTLN